MEGRSRESLRSGAVPVRLGWSMAAAKFLTEPRLLVSGLSWATSDLRAQEEAISVKVPSAVGGQSREEVGKIGSG